MANSSRIDASMKKTLSYGLALLTSFALGSQTSWAWNSADAAFESGSGGISRCAAEISMVSVMALSSYNA